MNRRSPGCALVQKVIVLGKRPSEDGPAQERNFWGPSLGNGATYVPYLLCVSCGVLAVSIHKNLSVVSVFQGGTA